MREGEGVGVACQKPCYFAFRATDSWYNTESGREGISRKLWLIKNDVNNYKYIFCFAYFLQIRQKSLAGNVKKQEEEGEGGEGAAEEKDVDDDMEYYRQEVGEEPDPGILFKKNISFLLSFPYSSLQISNPCSIIRSRLLRNLRWI